MVPNKSEEDQMPERSVARSSESGRFVSRIYAAQHKARTVVSRVAAPKPRTAEAHQQAIADAVVAAEQAGYSVFVASTLQPIRSVDGDVDIAVRQL